MDCDMDSLDDERKKRRHQNRRLQSERSEHVMVMKGNTVNEPSGSESDDWESSFPEDESKKLQHQNMGKASQLEWPQSVMVWKSNRFDLSMPTKTETQAKTEKISRISEMWVNVIKNPNLWKTEEWPLYFSENVSNSAKYCVSDEDYENTITDFVLEEIKEVRVSKGETIHEKRFREILLKPKFPKVSSEFYIPPAQVELFYQMLSDNVSAQKCLEEVCKVRKWPLPRYTTVQQFGRFFSTCLLKRKRFTSTKPASDSQLSMELAATRCLNWLGLTMKKAAAFSRYLNDWYSSEESD